MNGRDNTQGDGQGGGQGDGQGDEFEFGLREWMAQGAEAVQPAAVPYPAIVRQGRAERRRRLAVAGAALVALAVVPVTALAFTGNAGGGPAVVSVAGGPTPSAAPPSPPPPAGPTAPATPGQLADGITLQVAAAGLEQCLDYDRQHVTPSGIQRPDLGVASDYRILLAHRSTGNDNTPGDGRFIVAVKDGPTQARLICNIKDGGASGINASSGGNSDPESGSVAPDINGGKLYLQRLSSEGPWKLPYRWGSIGTVDAGVARVTVSYGGATVEAALDHGWFAATGVLDEAVTKAPRIKGYDAQGKQVYDSDQDKGYDKLLP
ncbi:hypothetical protein J7F03_22895 [Streptomyces sp. ISL-43]|uniref:hypothetical protein n=1 Tax=Streptomyces sp. ISL-43 TaxID=2819183 RepID=UPI001BEC71EE|nr:hypothetical protein [Streptomyces sp. ISL-43]MBT2449868.1 hypothetical protein [Streptomyces sp. ISL-43]